MEINKENGSFEEQLIKYRPDLLFKFNAIGELLTINEPTEPYSYKPPILYACWGKGVFKKRPGFLYPSGASRRI